MTLRGKERGTAAGVQPVGGDGRDRLRVEARGAVQGVGFRPFVYRLATVLGLAGWVINDSRGVFIEVEGPRPSLDAFLARLPAERPPRAVIQDLQYAWLEPAGYEGFEIRHSDGHGSKTVLVLPDIATCPDCLGDLLDPANRRYRYPFTNCTNCGPRFTIIEALPYDRPSTTMRRFELCEACRLEYESPLDRRFHAQPNACPACGPSLALYGKGQDLGGEGVSAGERGAGSAPPPMLSTLPSKFPKSVRGWSLCAERDAALRQAGVALHRGAIVAVKGLGGFHLVADARNAAAIRRLRAGKPRREKPFAVMVADLAQAQALCEVPEAAATLLASPEAPIVLLRRRAGNGAGLAEEVAPGNPNLGVMLPYTPLHHLLLRELGFPVVATSGNLADEPICTDEWEALDRLGEVADLFLIHDRPIHRHVDDSVATIMLGEPRLLRRARGYAPMPVRLAREVPTILAVGGHLKNTVALSVGRQVFVSQHIGDLETPEALDAFERVIADFMRLYEVTPVALAHDLHPEYASTQWARELDGLREKARSPEGVKVRDERSPSSTFPLAALAGAGLRLVAVQHHHAHLAACLAENGSEGPALGVTWDGTGYGTDGTVWGGEFLLGDATGFARVAHLRPFRLPGGEAAIKEPGRLALALLWELYGDDALAWDDLDSVRAYRPAERRILAQMLQRGTHAPVTTSAGRLFDGIAALAGLKQRVTFEGQAAMALEFASDEHVVDAYPFDLTGPSSHGQFSAVLGKAPVQPEAPDRQRNTASARENGSGTGEQEVHATSAPLVLDWAPIVQNVLADVRSHVPVGTIGARFHNALAQSILEVARSVGCPRVALTGGCFQNRLLVERAARSLRSAGFEVLLHRQVPPNDGGISLGQVAVAAARLARDG